ncbi:hypothetical protein LCM4573_26360 [Rhizobium sp. LCM 4573]|nr:hypothetical protein LCM4573_26360 [Rhizobium sp. LCM 4573]
MLDRRRDDEEPRFYTGFPIIVILTVMGCMTGYLIFGTNYLEPPKKVKVHFDLLKTNMTPNER